MYAGQVVEFGSVFQVFDKPAHPYTVGLLNSTPKLGQLQDRFRIIKGTIPSPAKWPSGCRFHPRCFTAKKQCRHKLPNLVEVETGHMVRCWFPLR